MYCVKCGYKIDDSDEFCRKCGNTINLSAKDYQPPVQQQSYQIPVQASGYETTMQQPPVYYTPKQQTSGYHRPELTGESVWGKFGGLMIFVPLIILTFIIGAASSGAFLRERNLAVLGKQILKLLPIAFAVGLTVKHKGLDMSFPAMVAISSVICYTANSLALGILLSLLVCIVIGSINAVCIHFLKLPGLLVTISTYLIITLVFTVLSKAPMGKMLDNAPELMYVVILIATIIAVGVALLSSIGKDHRNRFWPTLVVYVGSGILAALYIIALSLDIGSVYTWHANWMFLPVLLVGAFLCVTRFFKNKAISLVFVIIPVIFIVLIRNVSYLIRLDTFYHVNILFGLVLILLFVLFYRGRSQLLGQSCDRRFNAKSWIGMIPLLLLIAVEIVIGVVLMITGGGYSPALAFLDGTVMNVILLVAAVGVCLAHCLSKPKGASIV